MSVSITSNQLYELRPLCDLTKNLAIGSSSHVDGAKAIIYDELYYVNDQKWILLDNSTGWSIKNMESLKSAVIWWPTSASPFVVGQDIVQWQGDQLGENGLWTLEDAGTATVGGQSRQVVIFRCASHTNLAISVSDGEYYGSVQVRLAAYDNTKDTQKWVCIPTVARDYGVSAPYNMDVSGSTVKNATSSSISFSVTPKWSVTKDVAARSGVTYLIRYRTRTMGLNGKWNAWSDWAGWTELTESTGYIRTGQNVSASSAISASVSTSAKMAQVAYQVRTCVPGSGSGDVWDRPWASAATDHTVRLYPKPVITVSTSTWSPEGLSINATSSYASRGATTVTVESIKVSGTEYIKEPVTSTLIGSSGTTIEIPQDMLLRIPNSGSTLSVTYSVGSDTKSAFSGTSTGTSSLSYSSNTVTPTVSDNAGMTKKVTVSGSSDTRVWMLLDGVLYDCPDGVVTYPFGKNYTLFASGTVSSSKFCWSQSYTGEPRGVHAWNWDDGNACLEVREGEPLSVDDSIEASSESYDLSGRSWETVDFSGVKHQKVTVKGAVAVGVTQSQRSDFALLPGIHAVYRSPRGDIFPVAVLSVSREAHRNWTSIDVSMSREG